jgi:N-acyl-D-amino-acid deacylase
MPRPSRRAFLASAASVVITGGLRPPLRGADLPITGVENPNLAPFDKLLAGFVAEHKLPGAAVAVTRGGKLVYARGFGFADVEKKAPVRPESMFRLASISKPITAVAVMQLVERKKVKLDDPVLKYVTLKPAVPDGAKADERWAKVTLRHCLQHTGGWDRDRKGGFDPIAVPTRISRALELRGPPSPGDIVRYMLGQPLDFDPGARYAYSNLGYLLLGRVIEKVTGAKYEPWVRKNVLAPVKAGGMVLAKALPEDRPKLEVKYYDARKRTGACLYPPKAGQQVPQPDGAASVESYEAHGGWVSSAVDLARFAAALDYGRKSPLLSAEAVKEMWTRPEGKPGLDEDGKPKDAYYGCGWNVRPAGDDGRANTWHTGSIGGTSTLLVRRWDGLNWAVLFNTDTDADGKRPANLIDGPMHDAADAVKKWPEADLFERFPAGK